MLRFLFLKDNTERVIARYIRNVFGFHPRKIEIYKVALIHRSLSEKNSVVGFLNNERLEYLGDAVLSAVVADFLFKKFPLFAEGPLTEIRSKIVCRERLNQLCRKIGLDSLMKIDENLYVKSANGDAFEALVGAIYLDQGYANTKKILIKKIILTHLDIDSILQEERNFKSKVLSWGQKHHYKVLFNHTEVKNGSSKKLFKVELIVNGNKVAESMDYTIKKAEQSAAEKAWEKIKSENLEEISPK